MIRKLYNWVMKWTDHPQALVVLGFIAVIESAFFIIPPDPLLLAKAVTKPHRSFWYAGLTTVCSVLGGCLGYIIGYSLWEVVSPFFFQYIFTPEAFEQVADQYQRNALLALFIAGFTPVPYKVFTIVAGATHLAFLPFLAGSFIGRGARFFLIGTLVYFFGSYAKEKIEKYLEAITIATLVGIVGFFLAVKVII